MSALLVLLLLSRHASAQDSTNGAKNTEKDDPKTTTRVTLGSTTGSPGEAVVVPIYVTPAENVRLGRINLQIAYVSVNLKFAKLGLGLAADKGDVVLRLQAKDAKNEKGIDEQTLVVTAQPGAGKSDIPSGLLGFVTLNINENGKPASISLRSSAEAFEAGTNKPVQNVRVVSGQVNVQAEGIKPIVNCYFFSH